MRHISPPRVASRCLTAALLNAIFRYRAPLVVECEIPGSALILFSYRHFFSSPSCQLRPGYYSRQALHFCRPVNGGRPSRSIIYAMIPATSLYRCLSPSAGQFEGARMLPRQAPRIAGRGSAYQNATASAIDAKDGPAADALRAAPATRLWSPRHKSISLRALASAYLHLP